MSSPPEIVFLSGVRTGFGAFGGALKDSSATDLGAVAAKAALERAAADPSEVNHVVVGNAMQTSADAAYISRHIGLRAGCPIETPALTVNRLCGSGFEAIVQGAQQILLGESRLVLAAGTESMSQAPHVVRGLRWGTRLGASPALEDLLWQGLTDQYCGCPMGITAENLAAKYGISRQEVDGYALRSQRPPKRHGSRVPCATSSVPSRFPIARPSSPSRGRPMSTCVPTPLPRASPSWHRCSSRTGS